MDERERLWKRDCNSGWKNNKKGCKKLGREGSKRAGGQTGREGWAREGGKTWF